MSDYDKIKEMTLRKVIYYSNGLHKKEYCHFKDKDNPFNAVYRYYFDSKGNLVEPNHGRSYVIHRDNDLPAFIEYRNNGFRKLWFQHGRPHRLNGPAEISSDDKGVRCFFFINGDCYGKSEYIDTIKRLDNLTRIQKATDPRWWVREATNKICLENINRNR